MIRVKAKKGEGSLIRVKTKKGEGSLIRVKAKKGDRHGSRPYRVRNVNQG